MLAHLLSLIAAARQAVPVEIKAYYRAALAVWQSPALWVFLAVVLLWERWRPAQPGQRLFSGGLRQDLLWFHLDLALNVALIPAFAGGLRWLYDRATGGPTLSVVASWPVALKVVVGVLVADLLFYGKHWLEHRVAALWSYHTVHHSQRELNVFTDRRQHPVQLLMTHAVVVLPLAVLGVSPFGVMAFATAQWFHSLLVHSNVRSNFGPLGWLIVSPQSHRIHHSIEPRHHDRNFGPMTTVWDRVFGTWYPGRDEYPATGVLDVDFPAPGGVRPLAWAADLGRQLWYPVRKLIGRP